MKRLRVSGDYVIAERSNREMKDAEYRFVAIDKELWNEGHRDVVDFEADSPEELIDWAVPEEHTDRVALALSRKDGMAHEDWVEFVEDELDIRICSHCGLPMEEGYCIEAGMAYYCTDDCLHEHVTPEEWDELYGDGETDSYWTEW